MDKSNNLPIAENLSSMKSGFFKHGIRYLIVGLWNTLFGIFIYTALISIFGKKHYLLICIPSNIIAITNAYIFHKIFVFQTKGNIIREYFRCYAVYGSSMLLGMVGMVLLVNLGHFNPIIANFVLTIFTVIFSYVGHRFFSFNPRKKPPEAGPDDN